MAIIEPKKNALLIAVPAGFLTPFDLSAVNIALPGITSEFSMDTPADWGTIKKIKKSSPSYASERQGHIS